MAVKAQKRYGAARVEKLWLEVPFRPERATLFHHWPGEWGSAANSGAVSEKGLSVPFKPFLWLGGEDGGLGWFAESSKGWQPNEANRAMEIARQDKETVLRIHLLDSPSPRLPLTFTFGCQATPVKPMPGDFHEWRICHGASYGIGEEPIRQGEPKTALDRAVELGVKTLSSTNVI